MDTALLALLALLILFSIVTVYLVAVTVSNLRNFRRLRTASIRKANLLVSILVPARNEERNIEECIRALLNQSYDKTEILTLDDHSSDETPIIVRNIEKTNGNVTLMTGKELPPGWTGKNWACHQLAEAATGDLLLFVDADTFLDEETLQDAVAALEEENADLLSLLPTRTPSSWLDASIFLVIDWAVHSWLPFGIAHNVRLPFVSVSFGQFMLFRRAGYESIGGYEAIRENVVDDVELGRRIKAAGLKWRLYDASGRLITRMYTTSAEALTGLGKNIFRFFGRSIAKFTLTWLIAMILALAPILLVLGSASSLLSTSVTELHISSWATGLASFVVAGMFGTWFAANLRFGHPVWKTFLFPFVIIVTLQVGLWSMIQTIRGRTSWKGRIISQSAP